MRISRLQIALISGLGVLLLAAAAVIVHQSRKLGELQQQRDTALQTLQETREELRQSQSRLAAALRKPPKPPNEDKAVIAQCNATIARLTSKLSAAQASVTEFQQKLSAARDENQKALASSSQHYQELQAKMQNQLDALQKSLGSMKSDLQNSRQHTADLEKANAQLQANSGKESTRMAERRHLLQRLQELDRRRESYLTSIGQRYRDITSKFRTMSGMLDANPSRGPGAAGTFSGAALDLIQNALSQSDNDFQHLSDLNAKAYQLEKRLAKM